MEILIYIWPKRVRTARGSGLPTDRCISLLEANILTWFNKTCLLSDA